MAHAFFPEFGGDAHFDNAEDWTVNKYSVSVCRGIYVVIFIVFVIVVVLL